MTIKSYISRKNVVKTRKMIIWNNVQLREKRNVNGWKERKNNVIEDSLILLKRKRILIKISK